MDDIRLIQRTTVVEAVVEQLKQGIIDGRLQPGQRLSGEIELAQRFGVSRPALREAMKALISMGLITRTRGGTCITDDADRLFAEPLTNMMLLNKVTVAEIYEARKIIEVDTAGLAAQRRTDAQLEQIEQAHVNLMRMKPEEFLRGNLAFHEAIALASGNRVISQIMVAIRHIMSSTESVGVPWPNMIERSIMFHAQILEAIRDRDPERACAKTFEHLQDLQQEVDAASGAPVR